MVNELVLEERDQKMLGRDMHAGLFQKTMGRLWKDQPDSEKEKWKKTAQSIINDDETSSIEKVYV